MHLFPCNLEGAQIFLFPRIISAKFIHAADSLKVCNSLKMENILNVAVHPAFPYQ